MKTPKNIKLKKAKSDDQKVDVTNDAEMVRLGLRPRPLIPRDPSVWTKTKDEKKRLKLITGMTTISTHWVPPEYSASFPGKLIVHLKGFPRTERPNQYRTTVSYKCNLSDVETILARHRKNHLTVVKYSWNGKTYRDSEVPVRLNRGGRVTK